MFIHSQFSSFLERVCDSQYLSLWLTHVRQNCGISAILSLGNRLVHNSGIRFIGFECNGLQIQRLFFFFPPKDPWDSEKGPWKSLVPMKAEELKISIWPGLTRVLFWLGRTKPFEIMVRAFLLETFGMMSSFQNTLFIKSLNVQWVKSNETLC